MASEAAELRRLGKVAKIIAMHVRNEMEDFHVKYLNDDQMRELNPIIRNAIYSSLVGLYYAGEASKPKRNRGALSWVSFLLMLIPRYWEGPELTDDLKGALKRTIREADIPEATERNSRSSAAVVSGCDLKKHSERSPGSHIAWRGLVGSATLTSHEIAQATLGPFPLPRSCLHDDRFQGPTSGLRHLALGLEVP